MDLISAAIIGAPIILLGPLLLEANLKLICVLPASDVVGILPLLSLF